jgi:hypothetical protein
LHSSLARRLKDRPELWIDNIELGEDQEGILEEMADFEGRG